MPEGWQRHLRNRAAVSALQQLRELRELPPSPALRLQVVQVCPRQYGDPFGLKISNTGATFKRE